MPKVKYTSNFLHPASLASAILFSSDSFEYSLPFILLIFSLELSGDISTENSPKDLESSLR